MHRSKIEILERKNRHLVKIARALLLNADLLVPHLGDAVIIAYLSLENKISHSIIFPDEPLLHYLPCFWSY